METVKIPEFRHPEIQGKMAIIAPFEKTFKAVLPGIATTPLDKAISTSRSNKRTYEDTIGFGYNTVSIYD